MSTPLSVSSAADDHLLAALEKGAEKKQRTHKKAALKKPCAPGASAAEPMELDESAGSLAPAGPAPQGQAPVTGEAAGMVVPVWLLLVQVRPLFGAVEGPRYHSGGNAAFSTSLGSFCERGT
ncbi:hypothetical protein PAPYR_7623 [Paratrimastix pyriformis]|uniref:Uncharacterized protein n=1 Tax=Paratrimastix pyriformis TaxID=342808 RepID=A0ABQ8UCI5_9EUKA|nr:hypothetical protein PAPYR_7623 [Paratrimastix pyriformis]